MLTDPQISACIVLYHSGKRVLDTVRCVMASETPVELYVVDNSPEDSTAAEIRKLCPAAHIYTAGGNVGFARANNQIIPLLHSRYHLLLNPDVTFEPDLLGRMMAYMNAHRESAVLTPRVYFPDGKEQFLPKRQPTVHYLLGGWLEGFGRPFSTWRRHFTLQDEQVEEPVSVGFATGCFCFIRTAYFVRMKGFDERFFLYQEDSDLSRRVTEYGEITYHPGMHITHHWARENTRTLKGTLRQMRSVVKFFTKWGRKW